jgi:hypothetical protein
LDAQFVVRAGQGSEFEFSRARSDGRLFLAWPAETHRHTADSRAGWVSKDTAKSEPLTAYDIQYEEHANQATNNGWALHPCKGSDGTFGSPSDRH